MLTEHSVSHYISLTTDTSTEKYTWAIQREIREKGLQKMQAFKIFWIQIHTAEKPQHRVWWKRGEKVHLMSLLFQFILQFIWLPGNRGNPHNSAAMAADKEDGTCGNKAIGKACRPLKTYPNIYNTRLTPSQHHFPVHPWKFLAAS